MKFQNFKSNLYIFNNNRGAKVILKQIEENRQEKILKDEMREQENDAMIKYLEQLQKEDWEEAKKRKQQQKKLAVKIFSIFQFSQLFLHDFFVWIHQIIHKNPKKSKKILLKI